MGFSIAYQSLYLLLRQACFFSGLPFVLLLWLAQKPDKNAGRFLSLALLAIITGIFVPVQMPLVAFGLLFYIYVKTHTIIDFRLPRKYLWLFAPVVLAYWLPEGLAVLFVLICLLLSYRLIQQFYDRLQPVLMDRPRFIFRRLSRTIILLGACCLLSLLQPAFYLLIVFTLIIMAATVLLKQEEFLATGGSEAGEREIARRLKEAVAAARLYEDPELSLASLGAKLGVHPHELSRIINTGLKKNFNDFINEFRVRDVARKMHDPAFDRLTLLGIAYECGFNSQRTFNRVFKEFTGRTPVEYKNGLKKVLPNDKMAIRPPLQPLILR